MRGTSAPILQRSEPSSGRKNPPYSEPRMGTLCVAPDIITATIVLTDDDQCEGLRVGSDDRSPGSVRRDSGLEPTPDPEEHAGSHDTNWVSNASAPVETISLF